MFIRLEARVVYTSLYVQKSKGYEIIKVLSLSGHQNDNHTNGRLSRKYTNL